MIARLAQFEAQITNDVIQHEQRISYLLIVCICVYYLFDVESFAVSWSKMFWLPSKNCQVPRLVWPLYRSVDAKTRMSTFAWKLRRPLRLASMQSMFNCRNLPQSTNCCPEYVKYIHSSMFSTYRILISVGQIEQRSKCAWYHCSDAIGFWK